ncbi:MAG TPA: hypothetical protein VE641_06875 [Chthoniobacterales bacterium]|nr:hypothetical protein [Chthoniobacterales bacterium]
MRGLVNRWRVFWKDFNSDEDWRFPELSPVQLQESLDVPWSFIDRGEYVRAEWMWSRKPKLILGEGGLGYAILVFVALLLLLIPQVGVFLTTAWCFTMLGAIARDVVRSIRWRREYEVSITRTMRGHRHLR